MLRTKCPFYGFTHLKNIFADSYGNQCALVKNSYSPCKMEMDNQEVCWNKCKFDRKKIFKFEEFLDSVTIFPNELALKNTRSWEGIPLRKWYNYIVKEEQLKKILKQLKIKKNKN